MVGEKLGRSKKTAYEPPLSFDRLLTEKASVFGMSSPDNNKGEHHESCTNSKKQIS